MLLAVVFHYSNVAGVSRLLFKNADSFEGSAGSRNESSIKIFTKRLGHARLCGVGLATSSRILIT